MLQREVFTQSEGDAWLDRNRAATKMSRFTEAVLTAIRSRGLKPSRALEIGCSSGVQLDAICRELGCAGAGLDPSGSAINEGVSRWPHLDLQIGTAEQLPFSADSFDLIVFGFCLYVCDRSDLFRIAAETDRCLRDGGAIVIIDFHASYAHRNDYSHHPGVSTYKMDYRRMFLWNPAFTEAFAQTLPHADGEAITPDSGVSVSLLVKSVSTAYPDRLVWAHR